MQLVAHEPDVVDPVDMAFDENGRIYLAEMIDYPDDPPPGKPPRSRIVMLEDRDGDGRIDHSTIFADHLLEVSGLMPWKGGLIAAVARNAIFGGPGFASEQAITWFWFLHPSDARA